tara:strand:- start:422 stop:745 length:324 start_codon:yes stop_codon:yes gene_type:complete
MSWKINKDIASLPWKVVSSFRFSRAFEAIIVLEKVKAKQISTLISRLPPRLRRRRKIKKTTVECIKNTKNSEVFSSDEGFIFKPIENKRSSTPISDGMSNNAFPVPS